MNRVNPSLISVIVPVYNVGVSALSRCLDSLVSQTYPSLEIIVVDDGSTDECPAICDRYGERYECVDVVHQKNRGLSGARNTGLDHAHGEYVAFVDSDDYVDPSYVETLHGALKANGTLIAACSVAVEQKDGTPVDLDYFRTLQEGVLSRHDFLKLAGELTTCIVAWNKLYAAILWKNLRFEEGAIHEDELVFNHLMTQIDSVATVSARHYHYVVNVNGIMHQKYTYRNLARTRAVVQRILECQKLRYYDLIPLFADQLISDLLLNVKQLDMRNGVNASQIREVARRIPPMLALCGKHLSFKQKMNLSLFARAPRVYLALRRLM